MYWKYSTLTRTGSELEGVFNGTKSQAVKWIQEKGLTLVSLDPDYKTYLSGLFRKNKFSSATLSLFFEDFYNMFETGISINEIFTSLKETTTNEHLRKVLDDINKDIRKGHSLTKAFQNTEQFPWIAIATLSAGEKGGCIPKVLNVLAKYFKRESEIKAKIIRSFGYPFLVFSLLTIIMIYISINVIPKLESLLPEKALHSSTTQFVLFLSLILRNAWWVLLVLLGFCIMIFMRFKSSFVNKFITLYYKLPVIGVLAKESALSMFFLNLSVLIGSGVPIVESLNSLYKTNNSHVAKRFLVCRDYILGGLSFSEAIERDVFFPKVIVFSIRKGEEMSMLDAYSMKIAEYYSQKVNRKIDTVIGMVQPALLAICAGFLMLIALSFINPIYSNLTNIAGGSFK